MTLLHDPRREVLAHMLVAGALEEAVVPVINGTVAPAAAALNIVAETAEVDIRGVMARDELGHQCYLPPSKV